MATDPLAADGERLGILRRGGIFSSLHPEAFRMALVGEEDADGMAVVTNGAGENDDRGDDGIACAVAVYSGASARACTYWD